MIDLKQQKQILKHQLRDDLIQIGVKALRHAFRLLPPNSPCQTQIEEIFHLIDVGDTARITKLVQEHRRFRKAVQNRLTGPRPYILETCLLNGAEDLLQLTNDERWLGSSAIEPAFVGGWNGASCVNNREMDIESKYQDSVLRPEIEAMYERVRTAEKELKKQNKVQIRPSKQIA
jgi:hypothetical protein